MHGQAPLPELTEGPGFPYLLAIHRVLFRAVYSWAGAVREVDLSKRGSRFASWRLIEQEGAKLSAMRAGERWLAELPTDRFVERIAWYMGELNVLHPFRDGNGRALREYVRNLAERVGHPLTWKGVPTDKILAASVATFRDDIALLSTSLQRQIEITRRNE